MAEFADRLMPMANGRMRVKLLAAEAALAHGVSRVAIASALVPAPVTAALNGGGTLLMSGDADGSR
jgi:acetylglutamate/LysW-gamma-L-alpha-aminoadipate kinase